MRLDAYDNQAAREAKAIRQLPQPKIKPYFRRGKAYSRRLDERKPVRVKANTTPKPKRKPKPVDFNWTPFN